MPAVSLCYIIFIHIRLFKVNIVISLTTPVYGLYRCQDRQRKHAFDTLFISHYPNLVLSTL